MDFKSVSNYIQQILKLNIQAQKFNHIFLMRPNGGHPCYPCMEQASMTFPKGKLYLRRLH